ncbi:MAG: hypothetical protein ACHRXM_24895 [Isosphaerales bacterium]
MSPKRHLAGLCLPLIVFGIGADEPSQENKATAWQDAVTYRMPGDAAIKSRVTRSAEWLQRHVMSISRPGEERPLRVIAWKDPTLAPTDPKLLAGYVITDTLWSAKALTLFDPAAALEMEASIERLGWSGNGLHDVLFHPIDKILHCPADQDFVHGFSLGRFPTADGRIIDLRVFRHGTVRRESWSISSTIQIGSSFERVSGPPAAISRSSWECFFTRSGCWGWSGKSALLSQA